MFRISEHASHHRTERIVYLLTKVGIGEILTTRSDGKYNISLTDTGIILIINPANNTVVTAYLADEARVCAEWRATYGDNAKLPDYLFTPIWKNIKKHKKIIDEINKKEKEK